MPSEVIIQTMPDTVIAANNSGTITELNVGKLSSVDGDGVTRFHALGVLAATADVGPMNQGSLGVGVSSNFIACDCNQPFTLLMSSSAAATITFFVASANSAGTYFQVMKPDGSGPLSVTFTTGQALAIAIPTPAFRLKIQSTAITTISLYTYGVNGG